MKSLILNADLQLRTYEYDENCADSLIFIRFSYSTYMICYNTPY